MNKKFLLACASGTVLLLGLTGVAARGAANPRPTVHMMGVRAQYIDLDGNWWHMETTCHLINTSIATPVVLGDVLILGPGGRSDIIATHTGLRGTVVQPLGEIRLAIDSTIPGVLPQTSVEAHGVRNVIFYWEGAAGTLNLTAVLERYPPGSVDRRAHVVADGYEVTF